MDDARSMIRRRIRELGITQNEAARRCGMKSGHLSYVLGGSRGVGIRTALQIQVGLGVPIESWIVEPVRSKRRASAASLAA
jgi:transcriptional regulator with XRE-family HTH domain